MPVIPAFWEVRQEDGCEFQVRLGYGVNFQTNLDYTMRPYLKRKRHKEE